MSAPGDADSKLVAVKGVTKGGGDVSVVVAAVVVVWRRGEETVVRFRKDREDRWARKRGERR